MDPISASVNAMFATAMRAVSADAVETLITVELAKLGVPIHADLMDPTFVLAYLVGRIVGKAGATREQMLAFLSNVVDESSKIEEEVVLPNVTLVQQLRYSRMLSAQVWEFFYAIEDAQPCSTDIAGVDADEKWSAAIRATTFIVEFQMLMLRSA